jgi:hypothetical protein
MEQTERQKVKSTHANVERTHLLERAIAGLTRFATRQQTNASLRLAGTKMLKVVVLPQTQSVVQVWSMIHPRRTKSAQQLQRVISKKLLTRQNAARSQQQRTVQQEPD